MNRTNELVVLYPRRATPPPVSTGHVPPQLFQILAKHSNQLEVLCPSQTMQDPPGAPPANADTYANKQRSSTL